MVLPEMSPAPVQLKYLGLSAFALVGMAPASGGYC